MKDTAIEFRQVSKKFKGAGKPAVSDVSLTIREGEFITILGSSGCGKTTLLKMVNRLYEPDSGEILLFGKPIAKENPMELRRKIGYVIQQVGLFPHMTVAENVSIVPKMLKWEPGKIKESGSTADDGGAGSGAIWKTLSKTALRRAATKGRTCEGSGGRSEDPAAG